MMAVMSLGWGEAMHSYMVVSVIKSRLILVSLGLGVPLMWRGVPASLGENFFFSFFPFFSRIEAGLLTAGMACLQDIQSSSHISFTQFDERIRCFSIDLYILLENDLIDQNANIRLLQRTEPKPRTSTKKRGTQLMRIVCNDAKSSIRRVFLHDPAKGHLRRRSHGIGFIEND